MKKGISISIILITLGLLFECLHFVAGLKFLGIDFSMLGAVFMILGIIRIARNLIIPTLDQRAKTLGRFKKKKLKKDNALK